MMVFMVGNGFPLIKNEEPKRKERKGEGFDEILQVELQKLKEKEKCND